MIRLKNSNFSLIHLPVVIGQFISGKFVIGQFVIGQFYKPITDSELDSTPTLLPQLSISSGRTKFEIFLEYVSYLNFLSLRRLGARLLD